MNMPFAEAKIHMERLLKENQAAKVIDEVLGTAVQAEADLERLRGEIAAAEQALADKRGELTAAVAETNNQCVDLVEKAKGRITAEGEALKAEIREEVNAQRKALGEVRDLVAREKTLLAAANVERIKAEEQTTIAQDRAVATEKLAKGMEERLAKVKVELDRMRNPEPMNE